VEEHLRGQQLAARLVLGLPEHLDARLAAPLGEFDLQLVVAFVQLDGAGLLGHGMLAAVVDHDLAVHEEPRSVVGLGPEHRLAGLLEAEDAGPARVEVVAQPSAVEFAADGREIDGPVHPDQRRLRGGGKVRERVGRAGQGEVFADEPRLELPILSEGREADRHQQQDIFHHGDLTRGRGDSWRVKKS
jgi:hypothetical protein